ncbi:MAG: tetratricopeptide repeat protein, partial [Chloroflexota bacterium]|nr:tetratricopeptide repeat protein [Chloroflexota bacterium]
MALPTGTVTFCFIDVVGSTMLWEQYPDEMREAMEHYDVLVEGIVAAHGGQVVKERGEGDSHFAVFARASDAVAGAAALQQALAAEVWPLPVPLRVRLALHTGEADLRAGDYYGSEVNRCARLRNLAHPGQILLSLATVQLARDSLPEGVTLQDLGQHRLKDLTRPEQVFQLVVPGLPVDFPPLQSLGTRPNNLPIMPTPLIGREQEVAMLTALLGQGGVRLVTVTGPGGMGKTRLSLQVAANLLDDFIDGVFFVALAPVSDPDLVISTIAETLHVQERGAAPLRETLQAHLQDKQLLLVLDNFEQVMEATPLVGELLSTCPDLRVLVTSREALRLRGEREYSLPPLPLPEPTQEASSGAEVVAAFSHYAAVELFVERAQAVKNSFTLTPDNALTVAEICRSLDGLPLAIELAAARSKLFSPQALLARLTDAASGTLNLLKGGARDLPTRHQTLRDTIEWSYNLLDARERALFRYLAVFVGGASFEAIEAVCNREGDLVLDVLDGVASLVDKSLLRQTEQAEGEPRFFLLRTIQEYALEQLEARGEAQAVRHAYAAYYLDLAQAAEPHLRGAEQAVWLKRLEADHDNLRAVLQWSLEQGDAETAARLAGAIWRFWQTYGYISEGRAWLERALLNGSSPESSLPSAVRAKSMLGAGVLAWMQADHAHAMALFENGLHLFEELGDKGGIATMYGNLGVIAMDRGDYDQALQLMEESLMLRRELGDKWGMSICLNNLGAVAGRQGDQERAQRYYEESLALSRELDDKGMVAIQLANLGAVADDQGDYQRALDLHQESLTLRRELGEKSGIARSLLGLGRVAFKQHNTAQACRYYRESLALGRDLGDKETIVDCLEGFALVASTREPSVRAARLWGATAGLREVLGVPWRPVARAEYEPYIMAAQQRTDDSAWADAWAEGRQMTLEQAIAYALDE